MDLEKTKLFIDTMDNNTNELYAALPERLYILWEETVAYIGGVGPMYYSLEEVEMWLETFQRSQASPLKFRNLNSRIQWSLQVKQLLHCQTKQKLFKDYMDYANRLLHLLRWSRVRSSKYRQVD